jgi:hypothetical protein
LDGNFGLFGANQFLILKKNIQTPPSPQIMQIFIYYALFMINSHDYPIRRLLMGWHSTPHFRINQSAPLMPHPNLTPTFARYL